MSDVSSIAAPDSNHSVSTDTEESFLMRQINKSQLFNNSNSNSSSSGSSNSRKQRRSFFRESYIDETGANKSFSVFQDVINETSDESRDVDISGLSSLDLKLVGNNSILGELDGNQAISRAGSLKENESKRNRSIKRNGSKRLSERSTSNELYVIPNHSQDMTSHTISSRNLSSLSDLSLLQQKLNSSSFDNPQAIRIPTPERHAPSPPVFNSTTDLLTDRQIKDDNHIALQTETAYSQSERAEDQQAHTPALERSGPISQRPIPLNFQQPTKKQSQSTISSTKSVSSTRKSILDYELSRKRSPGLPHLLIHNSDSQSSEGHGEVKIQNIHGVARRGLGFSIVGITPSIHSPVSAFDQQLTGVQNDDIGLDRSSQRRKDLELQDLRTNQQSKFKKPQQQHHLLHNQADLDGEIQKETYSRSSSDSSDSHEYFQDDALLRRIHYYRNQGPFHNQSKKSDTIAWLVFCISFLLPPLFFFLGFGILDPFIGHISPHIKRFALIMGFLVLLISLACIGIGFGVGLTSI